MAWWEYGIPGYNVYKAGKDISNSDAAKSVLFGSSLDPNKSKLQDAGYLRDQIQRGVAAAGSRQAPTVQGTMMNTGQADQFRSQQMGLAGQLGSVASGQTAGAGELAVQRQAQRALANAAGAAGMARGGSAVNAARASARGAGSIGLGAAGQAQQAAMGDQSNARQLLAGVLGQGREGDLSTAGANQQATQQANLANQTAQLQQMGMNDQAIQAYLQQLYGLSAAEMAARQGDKGMLAGLLQAGAQVGAAA